MVPSDFLRQAPSRCTFRQRHPCRRIRRNRKTCAGWADVAGAEAEVFGEGGLSTILPGLKIPCGSKVRLIVRKAS